MDNAQVIIPEIEYPIVHSSIKAILWANRKPVTLLLLMRLSEFIGNGVVIAALSDSDNADLVSTVIAYHDLISVLWGSFLIGALVEMSIKKGKINSDSKQQSITLSIASIFLLATVLIGICYPFYHYSSAILGISIKDKAVVDASSKMLQDLFDGGVPALFLVNWAMSMILSAFDYDLSNVVAQVLRLVYLVIASELWVKPENNPTVRFDKFSLVFLISYAIPFVITLMSLFWVRRGKPDDIIVASEFSLSDLHPRCLLGCAGGERLFPVFWRQVYLGLGSFSGIAPALIMEYLSVAWLAASIGNEALASMRGFLIPRIVLMLAGNGVLILVSRLAGATLGGVTGSTTDDRIKALTKYIYNLSKSYFIFNCVMGLTALCLSVALTKTIQNEFAPDNRYLGNYWLHVISMVGSCAQIVNDCEEGILNGFKAIRFKALTTPLAFGSAVLLGWGFIEAGGELYGLFSGVALAMAASSLLLRSYTRDQLPCHVGANIEARLFSKREKLRNNGNDTATEKDIVENPAQWRQISYV